MPHYNFVLIDNSGAVVRSGTVYRDYPPKVGRVAFGTSDTTWVVDRLEMAISAEHRVTMHCVPAKTS